MAEITAVVNNHPILPFAEIGISGHGTKIGGDTRIIYIEYNPSQNGFVLYVWGDISEKGPTHVIPLNGALEALREDG